MLPIHIKGGESYNELTGEFIYGKDVTLQLEHSLVSISKWESKWHKSFIHTENLTPDETLDYIKCMTITQNVTDDVYDRLTKADIDRIMEYINNPMTATTFGMEPEGKKGTKKEIVTAELIYYWMIANNIPIKCEKWHLNKLITLIRVCNVKNAPPKKRSKREIANDYAAMNAARKKQLNTRG